MTDDLITPKELEELETARDAVLSCRGTDFESGLDLQRRLTAWGELVEKRTNALILAAERLHAIKAECEREVARLERWPNRNDYMNGEFHAYQRMLDLLRGS